MIVKVVLFSAFGQFLILFWPSRKALWPLHQDALRASKEKRVFNYFNIPSIKILSLHQNPANKLDCTLYRLVNPLLTLHLVLWVLDKKVNSQAFCLVGGNSWPCLFTNPIYFKFAALFKVSNSPSWPLKRGKKWRLSVAAFAVFPAFDGLRPSAKRPNLWNWGRAKENGKKSLSALKTFEKSV